MPEIKFNLYNSQNIPAYFRCILWIELKSGLQERVSPVFGNLMALSANEVSRSRHFFYCHNTRMVF